jgi:hypothetical protein
VSGQLHAPAAFLQEKEGPVPFEKEAGQAPEPVWMTWRRGKYWPYWDSNSQTSAVQLLFRMHYPNSTQQITIMITILIIRTITILIYILNLILLASKQQKCKYQITLLSYCKVT